LAAPSSDVSIVSPKSPDSQGALASRSVIYEFNTRGIFLSQHNLQYLLSLQKVLTAL